MRRQTFNTNVAKLLDFILERENPYSVVVNAHVPLHNILTKQAVDREVANRLTHCIENGDRIYHSYRQEVFVEKSKKLSASLSKRKLPKFTDQLCKFPERVVTEKKALSTKDVAVAQKSMDIAKERGMVLTQILGHDVLPVSPLFEGDLPSHVNKSTLVGKIVSGLDLSDWSQAPPLPTHVVVDFMSKMRQVPLAKFASIGASINAVITSASRISQEPDAIHLVLDSYIEMSLKEGERMRRTDETKGIDIIGMNKDTPSPQQVDKFWASEEDKRNLQLLLRDMVRMQTTGHPNIITSAVVSDDEVLPATAAGNQDIPDLLNWIEEADARLVVHVKWAVQENHCERVVIMSNDTDTFALLLHYTPYFQSLGLQEIWQEYGTGKKRCVLPLHEMVSKLGT